MAQYRVAVISGLTYESDISDGILTALVKTGIAAKIDLRNKTVAVKPNLFLACRPEQAATTHPKVIEAVLLLTKKLGGRPVIVESPGGSRIRPLLKQTIFSVTGATETARKCDCAIRYEEDSSEVELPQGKMIKSCNVLNDILSADAIINVPKFKTHCYGCITAATKNLFGIVPGSQKADFHLRMPDPVHFFNAILDLNERFPPAFHVVDSIIAMEGDGPNAGSPKHCGMLFVGDNALAVDRIACRCLGIPEDDVPVLAAAKQRGMGPSAVSDVDVVYINDFRPVSLALPIVKKNPNRFTNPFLNRMMKNAFVLYPRVIKNKCTGCRTCINSCPVRVIRLTKGKKASMFDRKDCIRCYCCHELCPGRAIGLHESLYYRIASLLLRLVQTVYSLKKRGCA
jgi:uncharacterized protein (DUF362 family)/NAD-dependent dihydropyrimidine dehydrogenase PreA subunit